MAVIIGAGTSVVIPSLFPDGGFVSINFGLDPNTQRLWQLGSYNPYDTYTQKQRTFSLTAYGRKPSGSGGSSVISVEPSVTCSNPSSIGISVTPVSCGYTIDPFSGDFYVNSYSYKKEHFGFGQESWSFVTEPELDVSYTGTILFIRGISTGQIKVGAGMLSPLNQGVTYDDSASRDSNGDYIEAEAGDVTAGFPGVGSYNIQRDVVVTHIGGSVGKSDGLVGECSVTVPMETVYI